MVFVRDDKGGEYVCYANDLKDQDQVSENEKDKCLDTSQVLGPNWWYLHYYPQGDRAFWISSLSGRYHHTDHVETGVIGVFFPGMRKIAFPLQIYALNFFLWSTDSF